MHDYLNDADGETVTDNVTPKNSINSLLGTSISVVLQSEILIVVDHDSNEKYTDLHKSIQVSNYLHQLEM